MQKNQISGPFYLQPAFLGILLVILYVLHSYDEHAIANAQEIKNESSTSTAQAVSSLSSTSSHLSDTQVSVSGASSGNTEATQRASRPQTSFSETSDFSGNVSNGQTSEKKQVASFNNSKSFSKVTFNSFQKKIVQTNSFSSQISSENSASISLNPHLVPVCACESTGQAYVTPRQFTADGSVIINTVTGDVGMCQINANFHEAAANALGFDLYTRSGNIGYANMLFEQQGYRPWLASKPCWKGSV
jgi:hypothetical protein